MGDNFAGADPIALFNTCLLVASLLNLSLAVPNGRAIGFVGEVTFLSDVPFVNFGLAANVDDGFDSVGL